uniref:Envelope polyprotein n=1 Tax=Astyanax mexicanus TaxID=7994 RepID=A0A3B1J6V1_ASTMX
MIFMYFFLVALGAGQQQDIVHLTITEGHTATFKFDFCAVAACPTEQYENQLISADKYACLGTNWQHDPTDVCRGWDEVWWNTGVNGYTYTTSTTKWRTLQNSISIIQGKVAPPCITLQCNPIFMTIKKATKYMTGTFGLGADVSGRDPIGRFKITVVDKSVLTPSPPPALTVNTLIAVATGFADTNKWLDWVTYTALSLGKQNCYACSVAKPALTAAPFPDLLTNEQRIKCILLLLSDRTTPFDPYCRNLHWDFPIVKKIGSYPPRFTPTIGNYTCFTRTVDRYPFIGNFPHCAVVYSSAQVLTWNRNLAQMTVSRADIWWTCTPNTLRQTLPNHWSCTCALAMLTMPVTIISLNDSKTALRDHHLVKRSAPGGSFDDRVYIDEIGVPRGVPDQFKARNQIAAGFESVLFWWSTINKNVDWINYIYYNQQRFVNYTRDAVRGLAEQLDATSLMAWQNCIALDFLLAERGGVCVMFGSTCCTFIPNNTGVDGSVTKALEGLTSLATELSENSGIVDSFSDWLQAWFGKWATFVSSFLSAAAIGVAILITCGCCLIPCLRALVLRLIETALTKRETEHYYQMWPKRDDNLESISEF